MTLRTLPWLMVLALAACRGQGQQQQARPPDGVPAALDSARVDRALARHNDRVAAIEGLAARGVLELRWTGPDGREHFEPQVNARLWIERPDRASLRAEKLGDVLFWMGTDGTTVWLFDLLSDPTVLHLGPAGMVSMAGPVTVPPGAVADLLGLTRIDPAAAAYAVPAGDDRFRVEDADREIELELDSGRVRGVELLGPDASVIVTASLDRYRRMDIEDGPEVATLIDLVDVAGRGRIKIAFEPPTDAVNPRVFDLERLTASLKPVRVARFDEAP